MFIFRKARTPRQTLSDLDAYISGTDIKPIEWLAREVKSWGEFSYSELEDLILKGQLNELIDWQGRYAGLINQILAPQWAAAMTAASKTTTKGKVVLDDSDEYVKAWIKTHGAELVTRLSEESKAALAMIILHGQAQRLNPFEIAKQVRPVIGLTQRQAEANVNYREKIYRQLIENGMSVSKAAERADKAALKYAGKQHHYRAETIVNTELAFAYNRGAHMGVNQAIANGFMGRCEMVWSTAGTNRVCSRCMALKDTVVGHTDESGVTLPPLHPRCRCAIMYREIEAPRVIKPTVQPEAKPEVKLSPVINPLTLPVIEPVVTPKLENKTTDIESKNFDELKDYLSKLDDLTVRKWYVYHDERIHEQIDSSLPMEEKAYQAFELRNKYRNEARELMADQEKRRELDEKHPNKTWEETITDKMDRKNLTREEAIADIYQTAIKSNPKVNRKFNLE